MDLDEFLAPVLVLVVLVLATQLGTLVILSSLDVQAFSGTVYNLLSLERPLGTSVTILLHVEGFPTLCARKLHVVEGRLDAALRIHVPQLVLGGRCMLRPHADMRSSILAALSDVNYLTVHLTNDVKFPSCATTSSLRISRIGRVASGRLGQRSRPTGHWRLSSNIFEFPRLIRSAVVLELSNLGSLLLVMIEDVENLVAVNTVSDDSAITCPLLPSLTLLVILHAQLVVRHSEDLVSSLAADDAPGWIVIPDLVVLAVTIIRDDLGP